MTDRRAPTRPPEPQAAPPGERNTGELAGGSTGPRPRRSALLARRRRRRVLATGAIAAVLGVGTAVVAGFMWADGQLGRRKAAGSSRSAVVGEVLRPAADVTLVYGTVEDGEASSVRWITLLGLDPASEEGLVVYVPAHTAAEVPGRGLLPLADAFRGGGAALQRVSVENLLGIQVDRSVELSEEAARRLFGAIEPLRVDVPVEVRVAEEDGDARFVLAAGPQELSAEGLVDLLYDVGLDGDDAELGSRHLAFWQAYLESEPARTRLLGALGEPQADVRVSDGSPAELRSALASLGDLPASRRVLAVLPVEQAGAGDEQLFVVDPSAARDLLGTRVSDISGTGVAVQVLNGNGEPGVGAEVGVRLVEAGFRVVLSGNARRLDYDETLVITYDRSAEGLELAERARDLLGVGEVQVAAQSQGIVNLTIVVGKDYLRR